MPYKEAKDRNAAVKRYRAKHPEKAKIIDKRGARRRYWRTRNQKCFCCVASDFRTFHRQKPEGFETDHRVPLALGGAHCLKNLRFMPYSQHRAKGALESRLLSQVRKGMITIGEAIDYIARAY